METICKRCGNDIVFSIKDVKDVIRNEIQLDIFGNEKNVIVGSVKCENCGAINFTKNKEDIIKNK